VAHQSMMPKMIWPMLSMWVSLLYACDGRVAPQREWRPEDHGQPAQDDPARMPTQAAPEEGGVERAANALYTVSCAGCHGRDGRGQGSARPPGAVLPDFTAQEFQKQRSDAQLLQVIREGRGLMPAFGKQVNEQGQSALVGRIRRFAEAPP
jgi:mono/diheme cytochrome c family protein